MSLVSFGQPDDGIIQMAYVVHDIHRAIEHWISRFGVGPWFLLPNFTGVEPVYRGQPSRAEVSLAMSFAGHMNVELIAPNDDHPSVYREVLQSRGPGFHHWGVATKDFDSDLARHCAAGHEPAFLLKVPSGGRVAYVDTMASMAGFIELIELGGDFETVFNRFYRATIGWDGADPVRSFI
jgi:hypothetical protein